MEEFIIRNYLYRNLSDMLFRINKLHPDVLTDEYLELELERVKQYISALKFIDEPESTVCTGIKSSAPNVNSNATGVTHNSRPPGVGLEFSVSGTEPVPEVNAAQQPEVITESIITKSVPKVKRAPRKAKAESNVVAPVTQPLFTFDTAQFQLEQTVQEQVAPVSVVAVKTKKVAPSSDKVTSCQCAARVVGSSRNAMAHDYVSYGDEITKANPIYGRRCKNVMMDNGPFCAVHKKKCEYGIFTDEASAEVRDLCMKKYTRLKEIEDAIQSSTNATQ